MRPTTKCENNPPLWFKFWSADCKVLDSPKLTPEDRSTMYSNMMRYLSDRSLELLEMSPVAGFAFDVVKGRIDEAYADCEKKAAVSRENGKKGGRPRKNPENPENPEKADIDKDIDTERETDIIKAGRPPNKKFVPPTLDEVKAYVKERDSVVDAEYFIDFYASKGWKVGRETMKDWKAAFRRAEKWDCWGKISKPDIKDAESYKTDESEGFYFDY